MTQDARPDLRKLALLVALSAFASVAALPASAALGGDATTVDADAAQLQGRMKIARVARYAVHEIESPHGAVVREYVSPSGKVFGVAWSGPTKPDLRQVLGPYFDTYVDAVRKRAARGPVQVSVPGLVVQSSGHMRAFTGSAYIPEALPQGVVTEEIR
jgi:hypothetical protein